MFHGWGVNNFLKLLVVPIEDERKEGLKMKHDTKILMAGLMLIAAFTLMTGVEPAFGVDDLGLFELDANAVQDANAPPDDWEELQGGGGSPVVFTGIIADPDQDTIFVGGRKDIQDLDKWGWKNTGGFPDKDDITNAYAAAYIEDSNLIAYFGADRFANKGDAFMGFWFFQDQVGLNPDGSFSGKHKVGDILLLVNFPQSANKSPEIEIIQWDPNNADVATNLRSVASGVVCTGGGGLACAITNDSDRDSPWAYVPKDGTPGIFPFESFFEGGINLTEILGETPCFGSFMAETRSSEKFTATLKDFVLGEFPVCEISVSKECDVIRLTDANEANDTGKFFVVSFEGEVTNTGAGTLPLPATLTIIDDAGTPGEANDFDDVNIVHDLNEPLEPNESIFFSDEFFSNSNPPHNTVTASIEFSNTTLEADPFSVDCNNLILSPSLSLSKLCWTKLDSNIDPNLLVVKVFFQGLVCNDGEVPLTITVTDDKAGVVLGPTLFEPNDCNVINGSYLPAQANGDVNEPCTAMFSDTFTAVGTSEIPGVEDQNEIITANCPLCDDCNEP